MVQLSLGILYLRLGRDYLYDWDESIYAALGRALLTSKDFLTSSWNNELWFEKPPLITWLTGLGMGIFGIGAYGARFFMPLAAIFTLLPIYLLGKHLVNSRFGLTAMGLLGNFNLFLSRARTVNTDILLLASIVWTSYFALTAASPWWLGISAGLGVMAKGPAGLLALIIAAPQLWGKSRRFLWRAGLAFLLITAPWHLYQLFVHGSSFYTPYLLEQVIRRTTTPIEFHLESRWFYLNFLLQDLGLGVLIITGLGLGILAWQWFRRRRLSSSSFLAWWVLIPLFLFTLAKTRLTWYILPIYPGLALVLAYTLNFFTSSSRSRLLYSLFSLGIAVNMLSHAFAYVEPTRTNSPLPDNSFVAQSLSILPGDTLALLVPKNERNAEAILPASQKISSSFRYGGSPAVYWYANKPVRYYYNYVSFRADLENGVTQLAITSVEDADKVPPDFFPTIVTPTQIGFVKGEIYADR